MFATYMKLILVIWKRDSLLAWYILYMYTDCTVYIVFVYLPIGIYCCWFLRIRTYFTIKMIIHLINYIRKRWVIQQFSKWKFEFTGPNQILEFNFIYRSSQINWKIYWSEQSFTGLGPENWCSSWGLHTFDFFL